MVIKVHGAWYSGSTQKVVATMMEKGAEFELVFTDILSGDHKQPAFLALQVSIDSAMYINFR